MHYHQDIFVLKYWMSNYFWQLELQREKEIDHLVYQIDPYYQLFHVASSLKELILW